MAQIQSLAGLLCRMSDGHFHAAPPELEKHIRFVL
jgi:hypothetical protein